MQIVIRGVMILLLVEVTLRAAVEAFWVVLEMPLMRQGCVIAPTVRV